MSNNCLITKLKGVVDNDNLPKIGVLYVNINTEVTRLIEFAYWDGESQRSAEASDIEVISGNVTLHFNAPYYVGVTGVGKIGVKNKYNLRTINFAYGHGCATLDVDELYYCPLDYLATPPATYPCKTRLSDISPLPQSITRFSLASTIGTNFGGHISEYSGDKEKIKTFDLRYTDITGTMSEFATLYPNLNDIGQLTGVNLTGSIEDFVHARTHLSSPQPEGQVMSYDGTYCNLTFNGSKLTGESEIVPFSWRPTQTSIDGAVTDIQYNGVAIAIDIDGNKVGDATTW